MTKEQQNGLLILAIATVTEFVGLFLWVEWVDENKIVQGIVVLVIGLLLERISVKMTIDSYYGANPLHPNIFWNLVLSGVLESVGWLIWLFLADKVIGPVWAAVVFAVITLALHSYQVGYFKRIGFFVYVTDPTTIVFSALEAVTAYYWLSLARDEKTLLAAVVLFAGITIEHIIQGSALEAKPGELPRVK